MRNLVNKECIKPEMKLVFYVSILYRRNATYQGEIYWLKEQRRTYFRSALEMILLIQEAAEEMCKRRAAENEGV